MRLIDITGKRFGKLSVVSKAPSIPGKQAQWLCVCDCGKERTVGGLPLRNGLATSCGCSNQTNVIDITGERYGRLTVVSRAKNAGTGTSSKSKWNCVCDCGNMATVYSSALRGGLTTSCGCWRSEVSTMLAGPLNRTHGKSDTEAFARWISMRQRCFNPNRKDWPRYGGRGISICERWMTFENFYEDMGNPPLGMQIERVNNDGNYEPGNCVWATPTQQARNKYTNRRISALGTTKTLAEWAEEAGAADTTVSDRIKRGWDTETAVTKPPRVYRRKPSVAA